MMTVCFEHQRRCCVRGLSAMRTAVRGLQSGFRKHEFGLKWFPHREEAIKARLGNVLVGASYEMTPTSYNGKRKQVKKFSAFPTHDDYWLTVTRHLKSQEPQGLYEALQEDQPRCLYFDLDGRPELRGMHEDIVELLRSFVRWTLCGDDLGWADEDPVPLTLSSQDPSKYSCHVVFPQIQFANHKHMRQFVEPILKALPLLTIEEEGNSVPLLDLVVDRVPYMRFQLLRGPFACKLKNGILRPDTCLRPDDEDYFRDDPLSCFAGYAQEDFKLPMLTMEKLMESQPELQEAQLKTCNGTARVSGSVASLSNNGDWEPSLNDMTNLYTEEFQMQNSSRSQDFSCMDPVEVYETALQMLHPGRSSQFWSWFRISGVTYSMLERYNEDSHAKDRIWQAHRNWSRSFHRYDEDENVDIVMQSNGKRVSGLQLLVKLAKWDNPDANIVGPFSAGLQEARTKTQNMAADKGIVSRSPELFRVDFQRPGTGRLNLAGRPDIEKFEVALKEINPDRATHEVSRKTIQSITRGMLKRYEGREDMAQRILNAHGEWCMLDSVYDKGASEAVLMQQDEPQQEESPADLSVLLQMLKHDNPGGNIKLNFVL